MSHRNPSAQVDVRLDVEQLTRALREAGLAAWQVDRVHERARFDERAAELLGVQPTHASLSLTEWLQNVEPVGREELATLLLEACDAFRIVVRVTGIDQRPRHLVFRGAPGVEDDRAVASGVIADHSDQEDLLESRERLAAEYQALFESIPLPALVYDPRTETIVRWNAAAARQAACVQTNATAAPLLDSVAPADRERLRRHLRNLPPGRSIVSRWMAPSVRGGDIEVEVTAHDVVVDGRRCRVAIAQDVTSKVEQERALQKANERLEAAVRERTEDLQKTIVALQDEVHERRRVESELRDREARLLSQQHVLASSQRIARVGHWELDVLTGRQTWSAGAYRMLGYEEGEVEPCFDAFIARVHPGDRERLERQRHRSAQRTATWMDEYRVVMPDGGVRVVHELGEAAFDDSGTPRRLLGIVQDVTEMRALQCSIESRNAFLRAVIDEIPAYIGVRDRNRAPHPGESRLRRVLR